MVRQAKLSARKEDKGSDLLCTTVLGKIEYLCSVLFTNGKLQVYLDSSFVRTRKAKAYEEEEELCLGISCFERDVLYQIV